MESHQLKVALDAIGMGSVELDGQPVPGCYRTVIEAEAGRLTTATLHLHALDLEYGVDGGIIVQIKCPICDGVITHDHRPPQPPTELTPEDTTTSVLAAVRDAAKADGVPFGDNG